MKIAIACSLLLTAVGSPGLAQRDTPAANVNSLDGIAQSSSRQDRVNNGSSTSDLLPAAKRAEAESWMRSFAQCVVRGDGPMARNLIATTPASDEEQAIMKRIVSRDAGCLAKGKLRMKANWMRGALAEQLYLQTYPDPIATPPQPDAPVAPAQGVAAYYAYADCVVARNAPGADAVLRAKPGSDGEKAAYRQSMPTLSSCLAGGSDATLAIDRTALRGFLAEALYSHRRAAG